MAAQALCACAGVTSFLKIDRVGCSGRNERENGVTPCLPFQHMNPRRNLQSWILKDRATGLVGVGRKGRQSLAVAALDEKMQGESESSPTAGAVKTEVPAAGTGFGSSPSGNAKKGQPAKSIKKAEVRRMTPEKPLLTPETTGTAESRQLETFAVGSLVLLFVIILVEGVFLGAAGFLPDEWDEFALNTVYPSFSPTIGLLFAGSAAYGVFKYFQSGR